MKNKFKLITALALLSLATSASAEGTIVNAIGQASAMVQAAIGILIAIISLVGLWMIFSGFKNVATAPPGQQSSKGGELLKAGIGILMVGLLITVASIFSDLQLNGNADGLSPYIQNQMNNG